MRSDNGMATPFREPLQLALISSEASLEAIRDRWDALAAGAGEAWPFSTFGWANACLRTSPVRLEPYVITAATAGEVRFIAPLGRVGGVPGRRRLTFLASGASDYLTLLCDSEVPAFVEALWEFLGRRTDWDWMELYPVPGHHAPRYAEVFASGGARVVAERIGACPVLDLRAWEARVAPAMLERVHYEWRRLSRQGQIRVVGGRDSDDIRHLLGSLFDLHQRRWERTTTPSQFGSSASRQRLLALAEAWREAGMLDLRALCLDDRAIAVHMGARTPSRYFYYIPAFDPELAKHSPGSLLIWKLIEEASQQGIRWFDFLRGDEGYKREWGAVDGPAYWRLSLHAPGWRGVLRRALEPTERVIQKRSSLRRPARALRRLLRG